MMEVGRTWSFSKRFIRLLFPALVSPVRKDKALVILHVSKLLFGFNNAVSIEFRKYFTSVLGLHSATLKKWRKLLSLSGM